MQIFFQPPRKTEAPFPASLFLSLSSRAPPPRLSEPPFPFSPRSSLFLLLSIARFSRRFFSRSISFSRSTRAKKKERGKKGRTRTKAKVGNRCALSISGSALFSSPRASSSLPPFLSSRHVSGFAYWKEARWFSPQCYPLCIVHPECALNTSSRAGISASGLFLSRALEITSRLISGVSSSSSITKFRR